jgi:hypothetical protein
MPSPWPKHTRDNFHDRNRPFGLFGAAKRQAEETGKKESKFTLSAIFRGAVERFDGRPYYTLKMRSNKSYHRGGREQGRRGRNKCIGICSYCTVHMSPSRSRLLWRLGLNLATEVMGSHGEATYDKKIWLPKIDE